MTAPSSRWREAWRRIFRFEGSDDQDQIRTARFVTSIGLVGVVAPIVAMLLALVESGLDLGTGLALGGTALFSASAVVLARRAVLVAGWILVLSATLGSTVLVLTGVTRGFGDIGMMMFPVLVIVASLLLDLRGFLIALGLIFLSVGIVFTAELLGLMIQQDPKETIASFGFAAVILASSAVTAQLLANSLRRSLARTRAREIDLAAANRRLESEAEELELRNAELERFAYTVSHDLKSPLVTIGGFLGHLEKHAENGDLERFRSDLDHIQTARSRMAGLLDEILELSRIGRQINPPRDVPFEEIVREASELTRGALSAAELELIVADDLPVVACDRPRMVEVVQNILENAAKYADDGPERRVEIGSTQGGEETVIFFRDNGIGIPEDYQEKVFGLFDKLDPTSEGSGLGLALARRILEVHRGRIWLESAGPGHGATFFLALPRRGAEDVPAAS